MPGVKSDGHAIRQAKARLPELRAWMIQSQSELGFFECQALVVAYFRALGSPSGQKSDIKV